MFLYVYFGVHEDTQTLLRGSQAGFWSLGLNFTVTSWKAMLAGLFLSMPDVIASICILVTNLVTNARKPGCKGI